MSICCQTISNLFYQLVSIAHVRRVYLSSLIPANVRYNSCHGRFSSPRSPPEHQNWFCLLWILLDQICILVLEKCLLKTATWQSQRIIWRFEGLVSSFWERVFVPGSHPSHHFSIYGIVGEQFKEFVRSVLVNPQLSVILKDWLLIYLVKVHFIFKILFSFTCSHFCVFL